MTGVIPIPTIAGIGGRIGGPRQHARDHSCTGAEPLATYEWNHGYEPAEAFMTAGER